MNPRPERYKLPTLTAELRLYIKNMVPKIRIELISNDYHSFIIPLYYIGIMVSLERFELSSLGP